MPPRPFAHNLALALVLAASTAAADPLPSHAPGETDPPARTPRSAGLDADGSLRLRATQLPGYPLDGQGTPNDQRRFLESRLRVGGTYAPTEWLSLRLQLDALGGVLAGDLTGVGARSPGGLPDDPLLRRATAEPVMLRLAYATIKLPFGQLRVGQQAFSWGLGLLANDGEGEPDFGDRRGGSLVQRVAFATRPAPAATGLLGALTVFAAGDLVWRDPNARYSAGDRAFSGVMGARADDGRTALGLFTAVRRQTDRDDPHRPAPASVTTVSTTDAYWSVALHRLDDDRELRFEGEAAVIAGRSTRPYADETLGGATVLSGGGLARLRYADRARRLSARLDLGLASGDADPRDGLASAFSFHPDFRPGLVLYDHVLARLSLRAIDRLADPALVGTPPPSLRFLATQGAVTNAAFANAVARWRPFDALELRAGYLLAAAPAGAIDPYASATRGGYPADASGATPSRLLGHELDLAARYRLPFGPGLAARLGLDLGAFLPAAGLAPVLAGPVAAARLLADLEF